MYIDVDFSDDFRWNINISHLSAKSSKLGFIKRNLHKCSDKTEQSAYFTVVLPNLEYEPAAWGLNGARHPNNNELEKNNDEQQGS